LRITLNLVLVPHDCLKAVTSSLPKDRLRNNAIWQCTLLPSNIDLNLSFNSLPNNGYGLALSLNGWAESHVRKGLVTRRVHGLMVSIGLFISIMQCTLNKSCGITLREVFTLKLIDSVLLRSLYIKGMLHSLNKV
jgi:hypothetical protein